MYRLETQLAFFRFNANSHHGPFDITWYVLEPGDSSDENGRCFSQMELTLFQQFVNTLPSNFPGNKNYHNCEEEEGPSCGMMSVIPLQRARMPKNVILRKHPKLNNFGNIYSCMDIILQGTNGADNHTYNLEFDVIGRINNPID